MTREDIVKMTNEVFEESFEIADDQLVATALVFDDLGLDSLDTVDLVVALQKKFGVRIRDDERVRDIRTLGDIYDFIATLTSEKASADNGV